mgnify:CR=1 FL=1
MGEPLKEVSAGGVVYRETGGRIEIQLIRDRFGRLSLAKGKLEPGETAEQAAIREIAEETGIDGEIVAPLTTVRYQYVKPGGGTVDKVVHYYLVRARDGELRAQTEEIDGVSWHDPGDAWSRQRAEGYGNNDEVLRLALGMLGLDPDVRESAGTEPSGTFPARTGSAGAGSAGTDRAEGGNAG